MQELKKMKLWQKIVLAVIVTIYILFTLGVLLSGLGLATAADNQKFVGLWEGTWSTYNGSGDMALKINLRDDGSLFGTMQAENTSNFGDGEKKLDEVYVEENQLHFEALGDNKSVVRGVGRLTGDEIRGEMEFEVQNVDISLRRKH